MFYRVSTDQPNDDISYQLRLREFELNQLDNKMGAQTRILNLRDDPIAAAHAVRFESKLVRLDRYAINVNTVVDTNNVADGYLKSATDIIQRVRELAVQGANGTYTPGDLKDMGEEVNQLLNELVQIGNARDGEGRMLFAGDRDLSAAFSTLRGNVPGASEQVITDVRYTGTIGENRVEISDGSFIPANVPGNRAFWAEQQQLFANADATAYQVQADSVISIDGTDIHLAAGDNVSAVIAKINSSNAGVRASLDPVKSSLVLQTTSPHQLWLRDVQGTVLQDLGVLSPSGGNPPANISPDVRVSGGSLFDAVIALRDELYQGQTVDIGGMGLKGIDAALGNLTAARAELGAQNERLKGVSERIAFEIPEVQQQDSREVDLDMTKAITDLRMMEYTHQAALETAAKILPPTLLDYLR